MYKYNILDINENDITLFLLEESELNRCDSNVIFFNSGIYLQLYYFDNSYVPYDLFTDVNTLYVIYSEGRYGDYFSELILNNKRINGVNFEGNINPLKLLHDCSNVEEIVSILQNVDIDYSVFHGTEGICSLKFFELLGEGFDNLKCFVSFSHTTPYKIYASNIKIKNYYFVSLFSNNEFELPKNKEDYYIDRDGFFGIDYRIGHDAVKTFFDAVSECLSFYPNIYLNCIKPYSPLDFDTSLYINFNIIGHPELYHVYYYNY